MKRIAIAAFTSTMLALGAFAGCASADEVQAETAGESMAVLAPADSEAVLATDAAGDATITEVASVEGGVFAATDLFTERDLTQAADTASAQTIDLASGEDVTISEEGVYVVSGAAEDVTITVAADDSAKVQLVLNGVSITNEGEPAIYVASADKVFITTAGGSTNALTVSGEFAAIGDDNVDGAIFASDDIVLNGMGTLTIESSDNGIVGKDDVKVTGGTYQITAVGHAIEGKDSVAIADGVFTISAGTDAIHSENADDPEAGYVYIAGGTFDIVAGSDGVEGTSVVQIDGGTFNIESAEGIEGTYVQINDGVIGISASDDGINATTKSSAYNVLLQINGGEVTVAMGAGDTDALDANGDLIINGGTVDITAQSAFDYDGQGQLNGGTVYVNGEQVTELTPSMMGGGMGGMGGGRMGGRGMMEGGMGAEMMG